MKRSDALTALIAEIVDLDRELTLALGVEEEARIEFVTARQLLDTRQGERKRLEERRQITRDALGIIQGRDVVSDDVVAALMERARR
jgi:hypothetical protein